MALNTTNRWTARPALARLVRVASVLLPLALSFLAALVTLRLFDRWFPASPWLLGATLALGVAMVVLFGGERLARRLLPLTMLLKLALVFPDQVPSRFKIALRSTSPRRLAKQLESGNLAEASAAERVLSLVATLSAHDRLTRGHCERVRAVTMLVADEMGIKGSDRDKLEWAALLHDIGKVGVSPAILNKRGAPDETEWAELRTHPEQGVPLAGDLAEWMGDWVNAIGQHHERFDGSGYPGGLRGSEISTAARIVSVSDAFEVMTAVRSYKSAMSVADARAELAKCAGSHFDPMIIRSFASLSLPRLHRALGPTSWALSLPFRGIAVRLVQGASAIAGGSAPAALAGVTALVAVSLTAVTAAGAVDARSQDPEQVIVIADSAAGAAADVTAVGDAATDETAPKPTPVTAGQGDPSAEQPADHEPTETSPTDNPAESPSGAEDPSAHEPSGNGPTPLATPTPPKPDVDLSAPPETIPGIDDTTDPTGVVVAETIEATEQVVTSLAQDTVDQVVEAADDVADNVVDNTQVVVDVANDVVQEVVDTTNETVNQVTSPVIEVVNDVVDQIPVAVPIVPALPILTVPTVTVPTVTVPTVTVPTVTVPTVTALPIVTALPTVTVPTVTALPIVTAFPTVTVPTVTALPAVTAVPAVVPIAEVVDVVETLPPILGLGG